MKKGLGVSLLVHVLVGAWLLLSPGSPMLHARGGSARSDAKSLQVRTVDPKQMEKELRDALEQQDAQIVQTDERWKSEEAGEREGKSFLTRHNQKTDFETRAARVGKFKNVEREGDENPSNMKRPPGERRQEIAHKGGGDKRSSGVEHLFRLARDERDFDAEKALSRNTGRLRTPASVPTDASFERGQGFSATDDHLKDIAIGAQTILNAREYKFYGFYERVREKLSYHWRRGLDDAVESIFAKNRAVAGREQTTQLQVKLDARGQLDSVKVVGSSGYSELDQAAADAFRHASPFPNPPSEMLNGEKRVVIRWDFVLLADDPGAMRVQVRRAAW